MANENVDVGQEAPSAAAEAAQKKVPSGAEVKAASLTPLHQKPPVSPPANLEFLLDVPLKISVQLGSARMPIRDLLQLGQGSVVELEKLAGEPMDVFIGEKLIARGEVVVVNEKFGIRLTDIVSPAERIKQLGKG